MTEHYNAFISYRHAEADIKVAEAIERDLEQFHVPAKIRQKTGKKRINRIFRDKDELPITSDLTSEIYNALEDADYLIVICSVNTRESLWVQREIEYFLKNHSRKQILTVLVNGEPSETIPEILLSETRTITDNDGNTHEIEVPLEPLSCDYRLTKRKAKKEELPRLASVLLGCSYDELINRRRQYKLRRLSYLFAAIFLLAVGFGAYMFHSRRLILESRKEILKSRETILEHQQELIESREEIQKNYNEALKNQSRFLANESRRFMKEEKPATAMLIALEALPKEGEENPRPVTPEAVRALTDACYAYTTVNGLTIDPVWNYSMPSNISSYSVSSDGMFLAILDTNQNLYVWNTRTHEKVADLSAVNDVYNFFFTKKTFVVVSNSKIQMYNLDDFSLLHDNDYENCIDRVIYDNINDRLLCIISYSDNHTTEDMFAYSIHFMWLSAADGSKLSEKTATVSKNAVNSASYTLSPDKEKVATIYYPSGEAGYGFLVYDFKEDKVYLSESTPNSPIAIGWTNDSMLLAATNQSENQMYQNSNTLYIKTDYVKISCMDTKTFEAKWEHRFESTNVANHFGFFNLPKENSTIYQSGNISEVMDDETGELLYHHNTNSVIVNVSDNDNDGIPMYITENGGLATPITEKSKDAIYIMMDLADNIESAIVQNGIYVQSAHSKDIIQYNSYVCDDEWYPTENMPEITDIPYNTYIDDRIIALYDYDDEGYALELVDPVSNKYVGKESLPQVYEPHFITTDQDYLYLCYIDLNSLHIHKSPLNGGQAEDTVLPYTLNSSNISCSDDGTIAFATIDATEKITFVIYNVLTGETKTADYTTTDTDMNTVFKYFPRLNKIYVMNYGDSNTDALIDVSTNQTYDINLPEGWDTTLMAAEGYFGDEIAIANNNTTMIIANKGDSKYTVNAPGLEIIGLSFCKTGNDEILLVTYNDGSLYRYTNTGAFLGRSDLSTYINSSNNHTFDFDYENSLLYVHFYAMVDIIDMSSWYEVANIMNYIGYHKQTDHIYTLSTIDNNIKTIGYFKHYSTEELIKKSKDMLNGTELSNDIKSEYGIN
ncbi:MAG: toll/interleukin-1 receptor domain-containing protein [Eubacterium sp.]|nr:toll/interleukin-1 receptor domain-containing protein [Eubacterium sp.]